MTQPFEVGISAQDPEDSRPISVVRAIGNRLLDLEQLGSSAIVIGDTKVVHEGGASNLAGTWGFSSDTNTGHFDRVRGRGRFVNLPDPKPLFTMYRTHLADDSKDSSTGLRFVEGGSAIALDSAELDCTQRNPYMISDHDSLVALYDGILMAVPVARA